MDAERKISSISQSYANVVIRYYEISDEYIRSRIGAGSLFSDRSLTTYARIFIPELLDSQIKRCVYLDADGIVESAMSELVTMPVSYAISGVKDVNPVQNREAVGLGKDDNYICAGMMLFDLEKCREMRLTERFLEFIREHNGQVAAMDQGTINGTLQGNVGLLHPKYDCLTPFYRLSASELAKSGGWKEYYSQEELDEATANPVFVHFTPAYTTRPWQAGCLHPKKDRYLHYRAMTEFMPVKLESDHRKPYLRQHRTM